MKTLIAFAGGALLAGTIAFVAMRGTGGKEEAPAPVQAVAPFLDVRGGEAQRRGGAAQARDRGAPEVGLKVDGEPVAFGAQGLEEAHAFAGRPEEPHGVPEPALPRLAGKIPHASEERMALDDRSRERFGRPVEARAGQGRAQRRERRQHMEHVPEGAQAHDEDLLGVSRDVDDRFHGSSP